MKQGGLFACEHNIIYKLISQISNLPLISFVISFKSVYVVCNLRAGSNQYHGCDAALVFEFTRNLHNALMKFLIVALSLTARRSYSNATF